MKLFPIASYRKWLLGVAGLAALTWGVAYFILYINSLGIDLSCDSSKYETRNLIQQCLNNSEILHIFYFGYFLKSIVLGALILMCFPKRAFMWWRWFAVVSIPLLAWWIISASGDLFGHQGTDKASAYFFAIISVLIAITATLYGHFRGR